MSPVVALFPIAHRLDRPGVQSRTREWVSGDVRCLMIAPNAPTFPSRLARLREIVADLLIATALIWSLPLLLGAGAGLIRLLLT